MIGVWGLWCGFGFTWSLSAAVLNAWEGVAEELSASCKDVRKPCWKIRCNRRRQSPQLLTEALCEAEKFLIGRASIVLSFGWWGEEAKFGHILNSISQYPVVELKLQNYSECSTQTRIYIYIYIYTYAYAHIHTPAHIHIHTHTSPHTHTHRHTHIYIYRYKCI